MLNLLAVSEIYAKSLLLMQSLPAARASRYCGIPNSRPHSRVAPDAPGILSGRSLYRLRCSRSLVQGTLYFSAVQSFLFKFAFYIYSYVFLEGNQASAQSRKTHRHRVQRPVDCDALMPYGHPRIRFLGFMVDCSTDGNEKHRVRWFSKVLVCYPFEV
ncbi:hypothetical protein B0H15DRAFT_546661 [Mycena belliarum]|uniref:Uncharacterized protein n=1 Tax=Mycena belliarum TaxID=1033014 RepID=A0AAD6XS52_9AGAR|nr:hypothetical protein B0H15DRAFT_546661 [Mycena belliae]